MLCYLIHMFFICVFLPLVIFIYFLLAKLKNPNIQKVFLVFSSLVFYGYFNWNYLVLIVLSIMTNYMIALIISKETVKEPLKKTLFILGILFNVFF